MLSIYYSLTNCCYLEYNNLRFAKGVGVIPDNAPLSFLFIWLIIKIALPRNLLNSEFHFSYLPLVVPGF